jgi:hypothetical protein
MWQAATVLRCLGARKTNLLLVPFSFPKKEAGGNEFRLPR